jgi:hypothetical protein
VGKLEKKKMCKEERERKVDWMETIEVHKTRTRATDSHRQSTATCLQSIKQGRSLKPVDIKRIRKGR